MPMFIFPILSHATCTCGDQKVAYGSLVLVTFEYLTGMHKTCATPLALLNPSIRQHDHDVVSYSASLPTPLSRGILLNLPARNYHKNRPTKRGRILRNYKLRWLSPGSSSKLQPPTWLLSTWTRKQPPRKSQMLYVLLGQMELSCWPSQRRSSPDTRYESRTESLMLGRG